MDIFVTKKNGTKEKFEIEKIHKVVSWAVKGLTDVNLSDIEINSKLNIVNNITTEQIHSVLIDSAANLISEEAPDYQYVAGRLLNYQIRKNVWGGKNPPKLIDLIKSNIKRGYYTEKLLEWYTVEEINKIDEFINHNQDFEYTYCSVKQLCDKYIVKNQHTRELYETPQFRYIIAAMTVFQGYNSVSANHRMAYVKKAYNYFSKFKINLATPQLAGLGTKNNSYSSCFPGNQKILTLNGFESINSIKVGDRVLTHEGNYKKVLAIANKDYDGKLISINTSATINGSFQSTSDHKLYSIKAFSCFRGSKEGNCNVKRFKSKWCLPLKNHYKNSCQMLMEEVNLPSWTKIEELNVGDYVQIPYSKSIKDFNSIDLCNFLSPDVKNSLQYFEDKIKIKHHKTKWVNRYLKMSDDVLRLFGLFYAEGDANVKNSYVQFTLNSKENNLHEFLKYTFKTYFGAIAYLNPSTNDGSLKVSVHSKVLADFFVNYISSGFDCKKINKNLEKLPPHKQKFILKGIFEGDGFTFNQGIGVQMSNPYLMEQIKNICLRCGLSPSIRFINRSKINAKNACCIYLNRTIDMEFIKFVDKDIYKVKNSKHKVYQYGMWVEDRYFSRINDKTEVNKSLKVFDIQVQDDESFTAGGIAAHNCCLIEMLDTRDSINATNNAIASATCAGYGIGVNFGRMRSINTPVKNGTILHPGVVPFLKIAEANTKAWQKNGVRGGSATVNFPIWHLEIENIVQLKNATTGTHDSRVFNLDYAIGISKLFYERFLRNENITLFTPNEVQDLYDAFGTETFDDLYVKYEKDKSKTKSTVNARELFSLLVKERLESGRIYILNVDNVNTYGTWVDKVNMTNLCCEITQSVSPLKTIDDPDSEIGVCILSAINWLEISSDDEMEKACDVVVRMLDEIIDIQDYFDLAAKNFAQGKRSIGVGVTNLAAFLAKNKLKYTDEEALLLVDEWMEKQQYYLIKASIKLAQEKGKCSKFETSKYSNGFLPIDKEYKEVLIKRKPSMDWKSLRSELKEHGMRHTTLSTIMPCESCLKWDTKVSTIEGEMDFHQICEKGNIDWKSIEGAKTPKWFKLQSPISVNTKDGIFEVNDIYYNGFKETFSIEMDNGDIITATGNHKFLTPTGWKKVSELTENDEILEWKV